MKGLVHIGGGQMGYGGSSTPGVTRGRDSNLERGDTAIPLIIDHMFNRDGRKWRVTVVAGTFVIGTAIDAQRDARGEVSRESDIIRVML